MYLVRLELAWEKGGEGGFRTQKVKASRSLISHTFFRGRKIEAFFIGFSHYRTNHPPQSLTEWRSPHTSARSLDDDAYQNIDGELRRRTHPSIHLARKEQLVNIVIESLPLFGGKENLLEQ